MRTHVVPITRAISTDTNVWIGIISQIIGVVNAIKGALGV